MTADRSGIRARLAAATPGPWSTEPSPPDWPGREGSVVVTPDGDLGGDYLDEADADLIAHAPADLAALLAELDAKDAALARVRELADEAIRAIGTGGHSHWRSGGAGGSCSSCDRATAERDRLRAALDGDGTPGPTNATDAPRVAKRTADGASSNSRSTDGGNS